MSQMFIVKFKQKIIAMKIILLQINILMGKMEIA